MRIDNLYLQEIIMDHIRHFLIENPLVDRSITIMTDLPFLKIAFSTTARTTQTLGLSGGNQQKKFQIAILVLHLQYHHLTQYR